MRASPAIGPRVRLASVSGVRGLRQASGARYEPWPEALDREAEMTARWLADRVVQAKDKKG